MTPHEQQLITELFARLKQTPSQAKDAGADQLILIRSGRMADLRSRAECQGAFCGSGVDGG